MTIIAEVEICIFVGTNLKNRREMFSDNYVTLIVTEMIESSFLGLLAGRACHCKKHWLYRDVVRRHTVK